jgi:alpha-amylase
MRQSVCLTFRVHQPHVLKAFTKGQVGVDDCYIDETADEILTSKLADECYLPANAIILSNIQKTAGLFKVGFSISGTIYALEKFICNSSVPSVINSWGVMQDIDYLIHSSGSEAHGDYKNMLTDLEIRLIKEQVKKNRLDFIPFSPNAY